MTAPTITPDQIADLLDRAADRIERYGFVQHALFGYEVYAAEPTPHWRARCCADGAIEVSADYDLDGQRLDRRRGVQTIASREFGSWLIDHRDAQPGGYDARPWVGAIWSWNDANGRTADEVVAALRECAADARAEAGGEDG